MGQPVVSWLKKGNATAKVLFGNDPAAGSPTATLLRLLLLLAAEY